MRLSQSTVPSTNAIPELSISVIHLTDSCLVNVSTTQHAPKLAGDWACALPSGASTQLLKTASAADDASKSMAHRIAKRLNMQIFLSLDIPAGDNAHLIQLKAEKALFEHLKSQQQ